jgi:hypothetical protein
MLDDPERLLRNHARTGAFLDANVLLVYVVGRMGNRSLSPYKHTKQYAADFPLIEKLVDFFQKRYSTPHVLTEVSNLGAEGGPEFFEELKRAIDILDECSCPSREACKEASFPRLGLTDASLAVVARKHLLITTDLALHLHLERRGIDSINLNHFRQSGWYAAPPAR